MLLGWDCLCTRHALVKYIDCYFITGQAWRLRTLLSAANAQFAHDIHGPRHKSFLDG